MRIQSFMAAMTLGAFPLLATAQDINEAFNLSNLNARGTARSMGFGNALGSVGGDFSSLSVNPAGIGIYRSSELTLTPSLKINSNSTDYTGVATTDNNTRFNFNNFGLVFTDAPKGKRYDRRSWKTVSFGFGMNRLADFNYNYSYSGTNSSNSASLLFESDANLNKSAASATDISNSLGYMGYNSYLLNINGAGNYYSIVPYSGGVYQQKSVHSTGGVNEYVFSLGGNYKEKLMLGVTIGIPVINMHNDMYYQESLAGGNTQPNPYGFRSFNYTQTLDINGAGVNAKIGAIYKLTDHFRIGAAFHSPTWYSITDVSNPGITTARRSGGIDSTAVLTVENQSLLQNQFDYNLTTPWKGVLSATLIIDHFGFISADYEYVDYASMRYAFPSGVDPISGAPLQSQADAMNQEIRKIYQGTSNFRLGAEWKANSIVMVRGGFGYYGNAFTPYGQLANSAAYTSDRIDLSLGAGFRFKRFFTDIALVHGMYTVNSKPYTIDYSGVVSTVPNQAIPTAKTDYSTNNVALTLGMKLGEHTAERRHHRRY